MSVCLFVTGHSWGSGHDPDTAQCDPPFNDEGSIWTSPQQHGTYRSYSTCMINSYYIRLF